MYSSPPNQRPNIAVRPPLYHRTPHRVSRTPSALIVSTTLTTLLHAQPHSHTLFKRTATLNKHLHHRNAYTRNSNALQTEKRTTTPHPHPSSTPPSKTALSTSPSDSRPAPHTPNREVAIPQSPNWIRLPPPNEQGSALECRRRTASCWTV